MSTKNTSKTSEASKNEAKKGANVFLAKGAGADALQGRVGARTHAIHAVLLDAALSGALLTTKEITERATSFMQREDADAKCNATGAHLDTMKRREFIERLNGAWRLTDAALELCGATWAQDEAPAKKKAPKKTAKK